MDKDRAYDLLCNLLERANSSDTKTFLTTREIEALRVFLDLPDFDCKKKVDDESNVDQKVSSGLTAGTSPLEGDQGGVATCAAETETGTGPALQHVELNDIVADAILCVDFGTSFSKAFVSVENEFRLGVPQLIDLPIGDGITGTKLTTPSELLIEKDYIYFGSRARRRFESVDGPVERLIDSIKQFITLNADVAMLGENKLLSVQDPTQHFSKRDVLVLYLAHLMAVTEAALVDRGLSTNIRRRFTHPAWKSHSKEKNEIEMRRMMSEAILLARSAGGFLDRISTSDARSLLDQLRTVDDAWLPFELVHEPVREATAAGAGALLNTPDNTRTNYLVIDIGAGTTDVAAFFCRTDPNWDRPRVAEIINAADARNTAGNTLDNAFQKFVLEKSALVSDSEEHRAAAAALRRDRRIYKERLFSAGQVIVRLPTDENILVTLVDFENYEPVKNFNNAIREMVTHCAFTVLNNSGRIRLIATGGGAALPIIKKLEESGVDLDGKHINFVLQDPIVSSVRETYPDLVEPYPQIAVALGGSLPNLPEQKSNISGPITAAPPPPVILPSYKS